MFQGITAENYDWFAYTNEHIVKKPIKGIVLKFIGLGFNQLITQPDEFIVECAEKGLLYIFPYYNPWAWMNDRTIKFVDDIIDSVFAKFDLPKNTPIVYSGGSMGGLSALMYSMNGKRAAIACAADCPACDLVYFFNSDKEVARTLYSAFSHYEGNFEDILNSASPINQVEKMPKIPYYIAQGTEDEAVVINFHSDVLVPKLKVNHDVTYVVVEGAGHCLMPEEDQKKYNDFIFDQLEKNKID